MLEIYSGHGDTPNHVPFLVHNISKKYVLHIRKFEHTNLTWARVELRSLGLQDDVLAIELPLLVRRP